MVANFERMLIAAAKAEGLRPSFDNLPDGREIMRTKIDPISGAKVSDFYSRKSFIKSLNREPRRVLRICDPRTGHVLLGAPFSRAS